MNGSVRQKLYFARRDLRSAIGEHASSFCYSAIIALLGIAVGVYIGIKVGEQATPFGVFAELFHLKYAPFERLFPDLLRFFLYLILTSLAFFLPLPLIYPTIAIFLFGKYFGQTICLAFLSDSLFASLLSMLFISLPLLLVGTMLLTFLTLRASESRLCLAHGCGRRELISVARHILKALLVYSLLLLVLYIPVCGAIYLIAIAV